MSSGVKPRGLARHFDGWELGLLAIGIALLGLVLAVPLGAPPREVPLPIVDERVLARGAERDRALANALGSDLARERAAADSSGALFDLRALGSAFRAYGLAETRGDPYLLVEQRKQLSEAFSRARLLGGDRLVALRAYEEQWFLVELRKWESTGIESDELRGLSGTFVRMVMDNGWLDRWHAVQISEPLRGIFFKRRWNEIMALAGEPFDLPVDEMRAFHGFLLAHPPRAGGAGKRVDPAMLCLFEDRFRLRKVDELAAVDPSYPRDLARGVLLFRLNDPLAATQAFKDQLVRFPDGPYALRTRNYLKAAAALALGR